MPVTSGLDLWVAQDIRNFIASGLYTVNPLFHMMVAKGNPTAFRNTGNGTTDFVDSVEYQVNKQTVRVGVKGVGAVGAPDVGVLIGGNMLPKTDRKKIAGGSRIEVKYQSAKMSSGDGALLYHETGQAGPTMPVLGTGVFPSDNVKAAKFRYAERAFNLRVRRDDIKYSKGKYKLGNHVSFTMAQTYEYARETITSQLITGTVSEANQAKEKWPNLIGLYGICAPDNFYGEVDRTSETAWRGQKITDERTASLDLIDEANIDLQCRTRGPGIDVLVCGNAIFRTLKRQCKAEGGIVNLKDIPDMYKTGAKFEMCLSGQTLIVLVPQVAANQVFGLTLDTFVLIFQEGGNFELLHTGDVTNWGDATKSDENGETYYFNHLLVHALFACTHPWLNVWWSNVQP